MILLSLVATAHASPASRSTATGAFFKGHIEFSPAEKAAHDRGLKTLIDTALTSLQATTQKQQASLDACGAGFLFGYLSPFSKMDESTRDIWVAQHATCNRPPLVSQILESSCELFANRFVKEGFAAVGLQAAYARINSFLEANDRDGLALAYSLKKLGWKIVYWNPDVNATPDLPTSNREIVGITLDDHIEDTRNALTRKIYGGVSIDALMINFEPLPKSTTPRDDRAFKALVKVPYYIGISHDGEHVWSGSYGSVIEAHSSFDPDSKRNLETGAFHPPFGSPVGRIVVENRKRHKYFYYSGIIAIPPGPWLWF
jgi:hypothetical protein